MSTRFFKLPGRGRKPGTEATPGALLTDRQHQLIEQELALLARLLEIMGRYPAAQEDQAAVTGELKRHVAVLRNAISRLVVWEQPPTESNEGKEVFFTYASSIDRIGKELQQAVDKGDMPAAARSLDQIAKACNSCHHFFRLRIKDSVVGPSVGDPTP